MAWLHTKIHGEICVTSCHPKISWFLKAEVRVVFTLQPCNFSDTTGCVCQIVHFFLTRCDGVSTRNFPVPCCVIFVSRVFVRSDTSSSGWHSVSTRNLHVPAVLFFVTPHCLRHKLLYFDISMILLSFESYNSPTPTYHHLHSKAFNSRVPENSLTKLTYDVKDV
jgi:hypothetical protein